MSDEHTTIEPAEVSRAMGALTDDIERSHSDLAKTTDVAADDLERIQKRLKEAQATLLESKRRLDEALARAAREAETS